MVVLFNSTHSNHHEDWLEPQPWLFVGALLTRYVTRWADLSAVRRAEVKNTLVAGSFGTWAWSCELSWRLRAYVVRAPSRSDLRVGAPTRASFTPPFLALADAISYSSFSRTTAVARDVPPTSAAAPPNPRSAWSPKGAAGPMRS